MYARIATRSTLAVALAATVAFGAFAQSTDRTQKEKELAEARTRLEQDARRVAELSKDLGVPGGDIVMFQHRALQRPVLGVLLDGDEARGVRVSGVTPGSGAAKAGLLAGDRILSIDGKTVTGTDGDARLAMLRSSLSTIKAGTPVAVGYERDGKTTTVRVTPEEGPPVMLFGGDGSMAGFHGDVRFARDSHGNPAIEAERVEIRTRPGEPVVVHRLDDHGKVIEHRVMPPMGVDPGMHREIVRMARGGACRDGDKCEHLALAEAFRWNGLNLASVDAQLGRYFGTDRGVLVVSAGPDLAGLQAGDVIRKVDGRDVSTPRDVMDVLRAKPEASNVAVEYLRDRKNGTSQVKVPKPMRFPMPPMAPRDPGAPMPPPPPPAPEVGMQFEREMAPIAMIAPPPPPRVD
ncbi:PDZ domain-containing protein [Cognatilysobacter terrigena]|uniref:PDZ domain-containing protein n=1 Tax=Cognatilysobacter terrigena TaxID=2488749 RepID=UPI0010602186|nr:PDZ domain-containing protein [Lysobacter terrigena]